MLVVCPDLLLEHPQSGGRVLNPLWQLSPRELAFDLRNFPVEGSYGSNSQVEKGSFKSRTVQKWCMGQEPQGVAALLMAQRTCPRLLTSLSGWHGWKSDCASYNI